MPQFAFVAKDRLGNIVRGVVDAQGTALAANQVGQMGYALIELTPVNTHESDTSPSLNVPQQAAAPNLNSNTTIQMPTGGQNSGASAAGTGLPVNQASAPSAELDVLRADSQKRKKVEMDLARMGMKPDEIHRLINANSNTTAPPVGGSDAALPILPSILPQPATPAGKKQVAQNKAAESAARHLF